MAQLFGQLWARWKLIAHAFGNFQARLLLTVFYILIVPVFALVVKVKDPLHLRRHTQTSFWQPRPEMGSPSDFAGKQA